jgi:hypothetical protein
MNQAVVLAGVRFAGVAAYGVSFLREISPAEVTVAGCLIDSVLVRDDLS